MLSHHDDPNPRPEDKAACAEALRLLSIGLWPIPITSPFAHHASPGKAPIGKGWGLSKHTPATLRAAYAANYDAGVGILLGENGGVIDIEFDGCEDSESAFAEMMGGELVETMGWSSKRGGHNLFRYDARLAKYQKSKFADFKWKGVEVRIGSLAADALQVQSVCPPSLMSERDSEGKTISLGPRQWNGVETIADLPESFYTLADALFAEKASPKQDNAGPSSDDRDPAVRRYVLAAMDAEVDRLVSAREGDRNNQLNRSAFALGQLVGAGGLERFLAENLLRDAARRVGLHADEVEPTLKSGMDDGIDQPRDLSGIGAKSAPKDPYVGTGPRGDGQAKAEQAAPDFDAGLADIATAADLVMAQAGINWLWDGWIQVGVLTLVASEPGTGKTRFLMDLSRRLALGLPWPDGSENLIGPGARTLWIPADNQHAELATLPAMYGFDPGLLYLNTVKTDIYGGTELGNAEQRAAFEFNIRCVKPTLVFIDTITNTSDLTSHDTSDAKKQYKPLQEIAKRTNTAIVCVTHLNASGKTVGRRADEKVRTAIRMERPDPDGQPNRRKLWVTKSNSLLPKPLGITMGDGGNEYDENPPVPPAEPGTGPFVGAGGGQQQAPKTTRLDQCAEWLRATLEASPETASDIRASANAAGFDTKLLYRAKEAINVYTYDVESVVWWSLTAD